MAAAPRLVTPEAVVLQFETAGLGSRLLAIVIDLVVQVTVLVLATVALVAFVGASDAPSVIGTVLLLLLFTLVLLGYPIAFETLWRGRTLGKAALGLRVVTRDGAPIRFRHAAVRGFLGLVDFFLSSGAIAVIAVLVTADNRRLGDLAAGTLVLRERSGAGPTRAVGFVPPPGHEGYAMALDVSGLSTDEYGAVRSFLLRAATLRPDVRGSLALQVAQPVAARMRHTPPPGVSPEAFLWCVAAMVQRRSGPVPTGAVAPPPVQWQEAQAVWGPSPTQPAASAGPVAPFSPAVPTDGFSAPG